VTYDHETKYKRMQVLGLLKSHINDAVAITCTIGELVKPLSMLYQLRCVSRGNYQMYNGKHSEHKVWAPRRVKGWKQTAQGKFCAQEVSTGKTIPEVVPSQLHRLARCLHGWIPATIHR
jgi:hypothetical protein